MCKFVKETLQTFTAAVNQCSSGTLRHPLPVGSLQSKYGHRDVAFLWERELPRPLHLDCRAEARPRHSRETPAKQANSTEIHTQ